MSAGHVEPDYGQGAKRSRAILNLTARSPGRNAPPLPVVIPFNAADSTGSSVLRARAHHPRKGGPPAPADGRPVPRQSVRFRWNQRVARLACCGATGANSYRKHGDDRPIAQDPTPFNADHGYELVIRPLSPSRGAAAGRGLRSSRGAIGLEPIRPVGRRRSSMGAWGVAISPARILLEQVLGALAANRAAARG